MHRWNHTAQHLCKYHWTSDRVTFFWLLLALELCMLLITVCNIIIWRKSSFCSGNLQSTKKAGHIYIYRKNVARTNVNYIIGKTSNDRNINVPIVIIWWPLSLCWFSARKPPSGCSRTCSDTCSPAPLLRDNTRPAPDARTPRSLFWTQGSGPRTRSSWPSCEKTARGFPGWRLPVVRWRRSRWPRWRRREWKRRTGRKRRRGETGRRPPPWHWSSWWVVSAGSVWWGARFVMHAA